MGEEKQNKSDGMSQDELLSQGGQEDMDSQASKDLKARRRFLKAGLVAAPLVLTFKNQPVWAQQGFHISGASPWYRGPWNARGDVIRDPNDPDFISDNPDFSDPNLNPSNVLKFREESDKPNWWSGPTGGSNEEGVDRDAPVQLPPDP